MAFFWKRKKDKDKFSTSTLGLDKSLEELKAEEEAIEREFRVRFNKAIAKTRDSINDRLDNIFENRKKIDEEFLDELEEMLISTDIGVSTTMQVLDAVRKGVSRQEINDSGCAQKSYEKRAFGHYEQSGRKRHRVRNGSFI